MTIQDKTFLFYMISLLAIAIGISNGFFAGLLIFIGAGLLYDFFKKKEYIE